MIRWQQNVIPILSNISNLEIPCAPFPAINEINQMLLQDSFIVLKLYVPNKTNPGIYYAYDVVCIEE